MDDVRAWRVLPAAHPDVPVLLVATEFGPASYAVHVTDLVHVWAERLERRDICMRAFQENTTIDPSYDNEQMNVFLGKLQAAIYGADDASLSLAAAADGSLVLHTTSILPTGLQPLKWPIQLKKQSPTTIASNLVLPLVQDRTVHQRTTARLVAALQDKDTVINKLVDKLEAMGAGLESAFPTLVGAGGGGSRRKISRADMERRVRGLARFDEAAFRKQMNKTEGIDENEDTYKVEELVGEAFSSGNGLRCNEPSASATGASPNLENWWQELGTGRGVPLKRTNQATSANSSQKTVSSNNEDDDAEQNGGDEFQEPTPKRPPPVSASSPIKEEPPSPTPAKPKSKAGLGKIGRLGAIGKKAKAANPPPPPASEADDDTASEAEEPPPPPPPPKDEENEPAPTVTAVRPKPVRGGLGRIGGKKEKALPPEPEPEPEAEPVPEPVEEEVPPEPEPNAESSPKKPARGGLGRIGGGKSTTAKKAQAEESAAEDDRGKRKAPQKEEEDETKASPAPPPPPKEDPGKRAEVMQKAMEKHAAPVRKKRKF
ncbi:hypothetical protein SEUCBS139899_010480 [Sporothrix eucalyptigena]|uniref:Non-homologous end-joining factor 1 n=1 Tax=Sporothrix eucalyptigena TaxID=1812306 RepID=A0ABP0CR85_9PEZI